MISMFSNSKKRIEVLEQWNLELERRITALEDYLEVEYFSGGKNKPHYRKVRKIAKKLGRPRKSKQNARHTALPNANVLRHNL